ncbi:acyltransferase [beta proteobacterium AAP121]|nr:acyltransferase [beta proteobacterium AAP65]KPF94491.1 acyltransferase [beta proteobacterium AAP121]
MAPTGAAALGALQTLAFVHTAWWPLPLLALAGLVALLDAAGPRRAALLGWCYGTAWLAAGTWWLFISMHRYGGLPAPLAGAAVFALSAALSLYLALACAAYARWRRGTGWDVALFSALWLLAELARGGLFTGFPWVAAGYALVDAPLAALAPWVGVYGMGAVMAALAAGLVLVLRATRGQAAVRGAALALALPLGLLLAAVAAPADFTRPTGRLQVALLQTNVAQDEKFSAERLPESLAWVARGLMQAEAELVVAPETAVPLLPGQLEEFAPGYWQQLQQHFASPSANGARAALVGVPLGDFDRGYTNSVAGLTAQAPGAPEYRYDKHHLVPFGEFIPTGFRWFTQMMNIPLGDFSRGGLQQPSFAVRGQRVAPNICYEDLFGEELAQRFADPATAPTVMANLSNIGWFGNTIAIPQHLSISRLRTLELQRPMLRATNTGATAVVDHRGQVTAQLAPHTRGVLNAVVQGREGLTPFARWAARFGLAPLLGLALLLGAAAVVAGRRRPGP